MSRVAARRTTVRYMRWESAAQSAPPAHAHSNILETDRPAPRRPDFFPAPAIPAARPPRTERTG
jgi:hypothetical protein